jgi:hypothetical protein
MIAMSIISAKYKFFIIYLNILLVRGFGPEYVPKLFPHPTLAQLVERGTVVVMRDPTVTCSNHVGRKESPWTFLRLL